jgi:hypothetical protein
LKVELKKHLGLIPNENSNDFDPREFQSHLDSESVVVHHKEDKVEAPKSEVEKAAGGDGVDDDFFKTIRNLNV